MINKPTISADRILLGEEGFGVAARVAMQLGRESISNSIVAISELVKNAYDADAERVQIRFAGLGGTQPLLVIEDDGNGMSQLQLRQRWMVIGTSNKLHSARSSKKKRAFTGEKGLGRLGLDRLSEQTVVRTFSAEEERGTELLIDWSKYEVSDQRLESIKHELYSIAKDVEDPITQSKRTFQKGTQLVLYGLKDRWTQAFVKDLKKELTLLVSPFARLDDFSIEIQSGMNWDEIDGQVGSEYMLQAAEWKLESQIDQNGQVSHFMSSPRYPETTFKLPLTPWKNRFPKAGREYPLCGSLRFEMYFFLRKSTTLADLSLSKTQINNFLDANQGIRIYRDGFRVKPYGEPDGTGDWINLSYRRQQHAGGVRSASLGGWRVGYNQVVGAVFITRENNPALIDQTNRENLIEGPVFADLKMFALDAVRFFEYYRQKFEKARDEASKLEQATQKAESSSNASTSAVEDLKSAAVQVKELVVEAERAGTPLHSSDLEMLLDKVKTVSETVAQAQKANQELVKVTKEKQAEYQRQKDTLANLASLGILAASFGHETLGAANVVATNAIQLQQNMSKGLFMVTLPVRAMVEDNLEFILSDAQNIKAFAEFTLGNITRDKRQRRAISLDETIKKVFRYFGTTLSEKNIRVVLNLPKTVSPILAFQIDWESIFVNFITNAVWALDNTPAETKKIRVEMNEEDGMLKITFADSGCGIAVGTEEQIFFPTFSTKRNDKGQIIGTGMGLAIVKDLVESYHGGTIHVESPCDLGGAQFHIQLQVPNLASRGGKKT